MRLLIKQKMEDILFFDIETVRIDKVFSEKSPLYDAWYYDHMKNVYDEERLKELYVDKAGLYAEYGKIVCISIGAVVDGKIIIKSFSGEEKQLLEDFNVSVTKFSNNKTWLCGHNILDFDIPFVTKRCIINGVPLHSLFDTAHLKPWETSVLDTAILWRGTGWKKQSLLSILSAMGLPSPKGDISGKDVGRVFYEGGIDRIVTYCEKDVVAVVNLISRFRYEDLLELAEVGAEPEPEGILTYIFNGGEYTDEVKYKLKVALGEMSIKDKNIAIELLNTLPTKAKGKQTFITKKDIKELDKLYIPLSFDPKIIKELKPEGVQIGINELKKN